MFASRQITPTSLNATTQEIAQTQARLREVHLKYHLAMVAVLTPAQVEHYRDLRGYGTQSGNPQHHPQHH